MAWKTMQRELNMIGKAKANNKNHIKMFQFIICKLQATIKIIKPYNSIIGEIISEKKNRG